jgi:hypothetical protein
MLGDYAWLAFSSVPVKFFHVDLRKLFMYGPRFVHGGIVMLKQERAFPNCHKVGSTESSRMSMWR